MTDFLPHFREVENLSVLLDDCERHLESIRLKFDELVQIAIATGSDLPGYTSSLQLLQHKLFGQIDYFLDTSQQMLELCGIANCLDLAAFNPDCPPPDLIVYVVFQLVYLYGITSVHGRLGGHQPHLTALDEELETLWTRVQAQLQSRGY